MNTEDLSLAISSAIKSALADAVSEIPDLKSVMTDAVSEILSNDDVAEQLLTFLQENMDSSFCSVEFNEKMFIYFGFGDGGWGRMFPVSFNTFDIEDYADQHLSTSETVHVLGQIKGIESTISDLTKLKQKLTEALARK